MKTIDFILRAIARKRILPTILVLSFLCLKCDLIKPVSSDYPKITIMTNSKDPLILSAECRDGSTILIYGGRNSVGIPVNVSHLVVKEPDKSENVFTLDKKNRPVNFMASNGSRFEISWTDDSGFDLTIISKDGKSQLNTTVNLKKNATVINSASLSNEHIYNLRKGKLKLVNKKVPEKEPVMFSSTSSENSCYLFVTKCGKPTDAQVAIDITTDENMPSYRTFLRRIYPERISTGKYVGSVPTDTAPSVNPSEVCSSISGVLDGICDSGIGTPGLGEAICIHLTAAIAATGIGASVAAEFMAGCNLLNSTMEKYCETLGNLPEGASFCDAEFLDFEITSPVLLTGVVFGLPDNAYSNPVSAPGKGPYPDINLSLGSETQIGSFFLDPSSPGEDEDYLAIARILCVKAFSTIKISIVGTDGYQDSIVFNPKSDTSSNDYVLEVPGAQEGVRDVCTLEITTENGTVIKRTASLVFGK
jgi:hypothetical protein